MNKAEILILQRAAQSAVAFETATATDLLTRLSVAGTDSALASDSKAAISLEICQFAKQYVADNRELEVTCLDTLTIGFGLHLDALMPALALADSPLVKVKTDDDGSVNRSWTGYAANIRSVASGVVTNIDNDGIEVALADSFRAVRDTVQTIRAESETDEVKELKQAKADYRAVSKLLQGYATMQKSADSVNAITEVLQGALDSILEADANQVTADSEAEADKRETRADDAKAEHDADADAIASDDGDVIAEAA